MADTITLPVPPLRHSPDEERDFRDALLSALEDPANTVLINFCGYEAVSSMVLGYIMFQVRHHRGRLHFSGVCPFLLDSLKTLVGESIAKELVK